MSRGKQSELIDSILDAGILAGMAATLIVAPNCIVLFKNKFRKSIRDTDKRRDLRKVVSYMKARKYIEIDNLPDGTQKITITENGKQRYKTREFDNLAISIPSKWDEKWRVVLFDIPEHHKVARNALNLKLKELGFKKLQKSAWIYPYPCEEEIELIKSTYSIEKYVSLLEVTYLDTHNRLLKEFSKIL